MKENCKKLEIKTPTHKNKEDCTSRLTKLDDFVILTTCCGKGNCFQFGVKQKLNLEHLIYVDEELIPPEFKVLIVDTHKLTKDITLEELLEL